TRAGDKLEIQKCGPMEVGMSFDLKKKLEDDLFEGQRLPFEFPSDAEKANDLLKVASKAMAILYIIGVALTGLTALMSILGLFTTSRIFAFLTSIVALVSCPTTLLLIEIATNHSLACILCSWNRLRSPYRSHGQTP